MSDHTKVIALHRQLKQERYRIVMAAAENGALPAAKFLSHLADLDASILAVEAVLEDLSGSQTDYIAANDATPATTMRNADEYGSWTATQ